MDKSFRSYFGYFEQIEWQAPQQFLFPTPTAQRWLLEQGSLSELFAQYCQHFSVELTFNQPIEAGLLSAQESQLLKPESCLLRQVVLQGDGQPWALGRTLIPLSVNDDEFDLSQQGSTPLGVTIFAAQHVRRDALQVGRVLTPAGDLLARRSRLWMNDKPMLVAELFLPAAPIYNKDSLNEH